LGRVWTIRVGGIWPAKELWRGVGKRAGWEFVDSVGMWFLRLSMDGKRGRLAAARTGVLVNEV